MPFNYRLGEGNLIFCCAGSRDNYFGSVGKIIIIVLSFRHCVKSVRIQSYSSPHFPASDWYWEIRSISLYSVRMRENADQNNSKYGHFLRSECCYFPTTQNPWSHFVSISSRQMNKSVLDEKLVNFAEVQRKISSTTKSFHILDPL